MTEILGVFTLIGIVLCVCYCMLIEDQPKASAQNSETQIKTQPVVGHNDDKDYESAHSDFDE